MAFDLYLVTAPHFVGSFAANDETKLIVTSAPILAWARGKQVASIIEYCKSKNWHIECLEKSGNPSL